MNMYFTAQNQGNIPATYDCDVCEGNWYEDRCTSQYDTKKKRDYLLPNPNAWQYETVPMRSATNRLITSATR